jgi:hypothetical protein
MNELYYSTIRDYKHDEKIWTNEGYFPLSNIPYLTRDIEDDEEFQIEIFFENRWLKVQNIDFN